MQKLLETTYQSKKTYILNLCYWCLFTMQSEKAKLVVCFVNDYCILRSLFKTILNLKIKKKHFYFILKQSFASCGLAFYQLSLFKKEKVWCDPLCFMLSVSFSFSLCFHSASMLLLNVPIMYSSFSPDTYLHA